MESNVVIQECLEIELCRTRRRAAMLLLQIFSMDCIRYGRTHPKRRTKRAQLEKVSHQRTRRLWLRFHHPMKIMPPGFRPNDREVLKGVRRFFGANCMIEKRQGTAAVQNAGASSLRQRSRGARFRGRAPPAGEIRGGQDCSSPFTATADYARAAGSGLRSEAASPSLTWIAR